MSDKRWCFYVNPSQDFKKQGGYVPSIVYENTPGHFPLEGKKGTSELPWFWGSTLKEAQNNCSEANKDLGLNEEDINKIIISSMFPKR